MLTQEALLGAEAPLANETPTTNLPQRAQGLMSIRSKLAIRVLLATVASALAVGALMWRTAASLFQEQAHSDLDKKTKRSAPSWTPWLSAPPARCD